MAAADGSGEMVAWGDTCASARQADKSSGVIKATFLAPLFTTPATTGSLMLKASNSHLFDFTRSPVIQILRCTPWALV